MESWLGCAEWLGRLALVPAEPFLVSSRNSWACLFSECQLPKQDIQAEIESRSLPKGGWASGNGSRASVETTCYGLMALHDRRGVVRDNAIDFLLRIRNRDGSWPAFDGDDAEGCWTTALALIALRFANSELTDFEKSTSWLLLNKG